MWFTIWQAGRPRNPQLRLTLCEGEGPPSAPGRKHLLHRYWADSGEEAAAELYRWLEEGSTKDPKQGGPRR